MKCRMDVLVLAWHSWIEQTLVKPKSSSEGFLAVVKLFLSLFMSWQFYLHYGKEGG